MKRKPPFLIIALLFLTGCGAVITGVGIMLGSQSSSSSSTKNIPPVVFITSPSNGEEKNDLITIEYQLIDPESNSANILVEWKRLNDTNWNPATELPGSTIDTNSDGTTNLSSSPSGILHSFVWNSMVDIPAADVKDIELRITPIDIASGLTGSASKVQIKVMNTYSTTILGKTKKNQEGLPYQPRFLFLNPNNNRLYFSNKKNFTIASLDLTSSTSSGASLNEIGTGFTPFNGDNLLGSQTNLNQPRHLALGKDLLSFNTALLFCDMFNHRIRAYDLTTGFVSTIVGTGVPGYNEDEDQSSKNLPLQMDIMSPSGISTIREANGLYSICFSEKDGHLIRYLNMSTSEVVFYSGCKINGTTDQTIRIPPGEIQTIIGNHFTTPSPSSDGPIWTSDNTITGIGRTSQPRRVFFVKTPISQKRLVYFQNKNRLRVVNLEGWGMISFYFPAQEMGIRQLPLRQAIW